MTAEPARTGAWQHVLPAAIIIAAAVTAAHAPDFYEYAVQEDGPVEWATVGLFLTAFVLRAMAAVRGRRVFDALVALFCLFVAGEEISWGQRLAGYQPPQLFLAYNVQQELTLHNFTDVFGKPKWILAGTLVAYGVLLPLAHAWRNGRALLERAGASAPPAGLLPWFAASAVLLAWYPLSYTGEWVEMIAGFLFLAAVPRFAGRGLRTPALALAPSLVFALLMTAFSAARAAADPTDARTQCAYEEAAALVDDLVHGGATADVLEVGSLDKRVWTAAREGYVDWSRLTTFREAACRLQSTRRRTFALDPWEMAYWMEVEDSGAGVIQLGVYSFGPNRRRDNGGDDVRARVLVPADELQRRLDR